MEIPIIFWTYFPYKNTHFGYASHPKKDGIFFKTHVFGAAHSANCVYMEKYENGRITILICLLVMQQ